MALQAWDKSLREENAELKEQLMIAGKGGSPGQPYTPPTGPKPNEPYVPAPGRKLAINANNIRRTNKPLGENDDGYGENPTPGYPDWQLQAHGEDFGESGEIIQDPGFGIDPGGNPIRLPHMEQSPEEQERNKELHEWKFHDGPEPELANVNYGLPTERDKWLKLFQGPGGSLRNIKDPDLRKLILQRGAMKADASNNIRSLQSSGHQTVLDDNRPGKLKIIKQFKPPKA